MNGRELFLLKSKRLCIPLVLSPVLPSSLTLLSSIDILDSCGPFALDCGAELILLLHRHSFVWAPFISDKEVSRLSFYRWLCRMYSWGSLELLLCAVELFLTGERRRSSRQGIGDDGMKEVCCCRSFGPFHTNFLDQC